MARDNTSFNNDEWLKVYPDVKLTLVECPTSNNVDDFYSTMAAGNSPDIIWIDNPYAWSALISKGLVQPLDELIDFSSPEWVYMDAINPYKAFGKTYGVQWNVFPSLIYYNVNMFEDEGLKTPREYYEEGNWNYDALFELAEGITKDEDNDGVLEQYMGLIFRIKNGCQQNDYDQFTNGISAPITFKDGVFINNLKDPAYIYQIDKAREFWRKYDPKFDLNGANDRTQNAEDFFAGKAAMLQGNPYGTWNGYIKDKKWNDLDFEWDIVPYMAGPDLQAGGPPNPLPIQSHAIPTGAKNTKASVAYLTMFAMYYQTNETCLPFLGTPKLGEDQKPEDVYLHQWVGKKKETLFDILESTNQTAPTIGAPGLFDDLKPLFSKDDIKLNTEDGWFSDKPTSTIIEEIYPVVDARIKKINDQLKIDMMDF